MHLKKKSSLVKKQSVGQWKSTPNIGGGCPELRTLAQDCVAQ